MDLKRYKMISGWLHILCGILCVLASAAQADPLVVCYGVHNASPYTFIQDERLAGGIIKDLYDGLGSALGIPVEYQQASRKREEDFLLKGESHVIPISNPAWLEHGEQFNWTLPLFTESNRFVVSAKNPISIESFKDLHGKRLGTIRGYYYTGLMEALESGQILRQESENLETNFKMLQRGRIDCLIDSEILIRHYLKAHDAHDDFVIAKKIASTHSVQSAISKKAPVSIERINAAFKQMRETGQIERIIENYTGAF